MRNENIIIAFIPLYFSINHCFRNHSKRVGMKEMRRMCCRAFERVLRLVGSCVGDSREVEMSKFGLGWSSTVLRLWYLEGWLPRAAPNDRMLGTTLKRRLQMLGTTGDTYCERRPETVRRAADVIELIELIAFWHGFVPRTNRCEAKYPITADGLIHMTFKRIDWECQEQPGTRIDVL